MLFTALQNKNKQIKDNNKGISSQEEEIHAGTSYLHAYSTV